MSLVFNREGSADFEVSRLSFSKTKKAFIVKDRNSSDTLEFKYPLEPDDKYGTKSNQFEVFLFHKDHFATNDIYQITIAAKRLGWLFPIQALLSAEHDFAADEHFFPYSFNAYKILLQNHSKLPYKKTSYEDISSLEDFYGENTYVLIVYKKYVRAIKNDLSIEFDITNYLLFFYQYGYTYLSDINFSSFFDLRIPGTIVKTFAGKLVDIKSISSDLKDDKQYLNSLIQGLIKLEKHPLVKFHLLYSLVELFISKIFESEFKSNMNSFLNASDFYDAKENLTKLTNEKARIKKLISDKCPGLTHGLLDELKDESNNFLSFVYAPKIYKKEVGEAIYKVRSTIFHNFRLIPNTYESHLHSVIHKLESLILEVTLNFKL